MSANDDPDYDCIFDEADKLRAALADAISLLRDWEDYEPDDPECTWGTRRDEFLAAHEEAKG
jgi:hypothetical protein